MKKKINVFALTFTSLMIAMAIAAKFYTQYIPLSGFAVFRIDFFGPFEKLPAVLFGPLLGGTTGALVDFIGYFAANKTIFGFIYPLTITAFLNAFTVALLWTMSVRFRTKVLEVVFLAISSLFLVLGIISLLVDQLGKGMYYEWLQNFGEKKEYFIYGCLLLGLLGVIIYGINKLICYYNKNAYFAEKYFKLFITLAIPGLIFTVINTQILRLFIPQLGSQGFIYLLIPRLGGQLFESFYEAYIICLLLYVAKPLLKNRKIVV